VRGSDRCPTPLVANDGVGRVSDPTGHYTRGPTPWLCREVSDRCPTPASATPVSDRLRRYNGHMVYIFGKDT